MTRISPNKNPDEKSQELLAGVKKMLGSTPNLFTTLAHSSAALGYYVNGVAALSSTKIPGSLREQLALTVAGENSCDYCASAHTTLGKMQKVSESELQQNLHGKSADKKTQAALTFAAQIVELRGQVDDSSVTAIRNAGYSDTEIVEIVAVVTQNIFTNYFNHIAETEIDFPLVSAKNIKKAA